MPAGKPMPGVIQRKADTVSLSVGVPRATADTFRTLCAREGFSVSEVLRTYIDDYIRQMQAMPPPGAAQQHQGKQR